MQANIRHLLYPKIGPPTTSFIFSCFAEVKKYAEMIFTGVEDGLQIRWGPKRSVDQNHLSRAFFALFGAFFSVAV
jgi:hypothetical protein